MKNINIKNKIAIYILLMPAIIYGMNPEETLGKNKMSLVNKIIVKYNIKTKGVEETRKKYNNDAILAFNSGDSKKAIKKAQLSLLVEPDNNATGNYIYAYSGSPTEYKAHLEAAVKSGQTVHGSNAKNRAINELNQINSDIRMKRFLEEYERKFQEIQNIEDSIDNISLTEKLASLSQWAKEQKALFPDSEDFDRNLEYLRFTLNISKK